MRFSWVTPQARASGAPEPRPRIWPLGPECWPHHATTCFDKDFKRSGTVCSRQMSQMGLEAEPRGTGPKTGLGLEIWLFSSGETRSRAMALSLRRDFYDAD